MGDLYNNDCPVKLAVQLCDVNQQSWEGWVAYAHTSSFWSVDRTILEKERAACWAASLSIGIYHVIECDMIDNIIEILIDQH